MAFPTFVLITCILVIILIVVATLAIVAYQRRHDCYTYISPWCFNNWQCNPSSAYNPVQSFEAVITACAPTSDGSIPPGCACAWAVFYNPADGSCQP